MIDKEFNECLDFLGRNLRYLVEKLIGWGWNLMAGKTAVKIDRLIKLLYYLSLKSPSGGATLSEMAEKCGVSTRTVYRDIDVIENSETVKLSRPGRGMK